MTEENCEKEYAKFLADIPRFKRAMDRVLLEWKNSCEHYLTNESMNRIAWLGQSAACIDMGIPRRFRGGFNLLAEDQKLAANDAALEYLNKWLVQHGEPAVDAESAKSKTKADHY
jgi:hypothetical protein